MTPTLTIQLSDGKRQTIPLRQPPWTLGRSGENDYACPEDGALSRQHLRLELEGTQWILADLGSKNGTFLNGTRIQARTPVWPGDRIVAGHLTMTFGQAAQSVQESSVVFDREIPDLVSENSVITSLDRLIAGQESALPSGRTTHRRQWKTPLDAFLRAGRELSLGRPLPELFQTILDLSIEAVGAERGVLLTLEHERLTVQASRGEGFRISTTVRDRVLQERKSLLIHDAQIEESFRALESIVAQKVHTLLAVPLQTDNQVLGLIYVDTSQFGQHFTTDDLDLLTAMSNVAALRIERERMAEVELARKRLAVELAQAAEIQQQALPVEAPGVPGLDLAGFNASCRTVGGDYYDFIALPEGQVAVVVADVCGKGMPAALLMMGLQARVRVLAEIMSSPAEIVERLNRILVSAGMGDRFITLFLARYDPASQMLEYCNAGHNPPWLVRPDGTAEGLEGGGPVLGILPGIAYESRKLSLNSGDTVVLYSDGITEATNPAGEEFGEERLREKLLLLSQESASTTLRNLMDTVQDWMGNSPATDDLTLVVLRKT